MPDCLTRAAAARLEVVGVIGRAQLRTAAAAGRSLDRWRPQAWRLPGIAPSLHPKRPPVDAADRRMDERMAG